MANEREMEQMLREFREAAAEMRGFSQSLSDTSRASREAANEISSSSDLRRSMSQVQDAADKKRIQEDNIRDAAARQAYYKSEQALSSFTAALKSNSEDLTKYNSAISDAGDAVWNIARSAGPIIGILGGLFKGLTMFAEAAIKQADLSLKATDQLSKLGTSGQFSAEQVRQFGTNAGYTAERLDKLIKPIQSLGGGLITLGGSAAGGVKAFAAIANVGEEARRTYRALGLSQEELTQSQADYIRTQQMSGIQLNKPIAEIQKNSKEYIDNILTLSALTGEDIESSKKRQEAAQSEIQTMLMQNAMDQEINELKKKQTAKTITDEEESRLKLLDAKRQNMATLLTTADMFGPDYRKAVANALTGIITPEVTQLMNLGVPIMEIVEELNRTSEVTTSLGDKFGDSVVQNINALNKGGQNIGLYVSQEMRTLFGINEQSVRMTQQIGQNSLKTMREKIKADQDALTNLGDPAQEARNTMLEAEIALKTGFEDLLATVNPLMMTFEKLNSIIRRIPGMGEDKKPGQEAAEAANNVGSEIQALKQRKEREGNLNNMDQDRLTQLESQRSLLLQEASGYNANVEYTDALKGTGYSYDNGFISPSGKHTNDVPENVKKLFNEVYYKRHPGAKPKEVTAKDKGGPVKFGELALVGEYGPELLTGPGMVTGRQQTADILKDAMQGMQGFSSSSVRTQQILNDRKLRDLAEEKENELETLASLNMSLDIVSDSAIELSEVFYEVEEQLRSIFGTNDIKDDENKDNSGSFLDKMQDGLMNFFGGGAAAPPVVPSDMSKLENPQKIKAAMDYFKKQGWSREQSAGILGNLMAESGRDLRTNAVGDGGKAFGIAQWHPDRQAKFKEVFGKDIRQSTLEEQLAFVNWELKNTERRAGGVLSQARSGAQAAAMVDKFYERSSGAHRGKRMSYAEGILQTFPDSDVQVAAASTTSSATAESMKGEPTVVPATGNKTTTTPVVTTASTDTAQLMNVNAQLLDTLSTKLDTMISKLDDSNSIQEKIMRQTA